MNLFGHLRTITHHKNLVMKHCFKCGLYKQGLLHDMSKYSPVEFFRGVKYYQGDRSPNSAEREQTGLSRAWLHHKGRNKHHLEYWIDYGPRSGDLLCGMKMPVNYVVEMFCDRMAASKTYRADKYTNSDPYEYYLKSRDRLLLHDESRALLESLLIMLRDCGEEKTFSYIRREVLKNRR